MAYSALAPSNDNIAPAISGGNTQLGAPYGVVGPADAAG